MSGLNPDSLPGYLLDQLPTLMRSAISAARAADNPFGCSIAEWYTGRELFVASNSASHDPTAHAEVNGIRELAQRGLDPRELVLVCTAEPCPMCASACWWAGIRGVVYGTSIAQLIEFGFRQINLPMTSLMASTVGGAPLIVVGDFLTEETNLLYQPQW